MRKEQSSNSINEQYLLTACGLNLAMSKISGRWKVHILVSIVNGYNRFNLLHKRIDNISEQVLGRQLKALEKDGIIVKKIIPETVPIGIEYSFSDKGKELMPILQALCDWGKQF